MASNGTSQPRTYAPDFSTRYQPFFGVALFQTEAQKRGRSFFASQTERSETRSSIFPRPISPSPPLVYPSQTTRYLQKRQSSLGFLRPNWQFRLSGISGALSFIRRRNSGCHLPSAPLFKVGNTLPTFLLKSPPPPLVRRLTREETASDSPCYPTSCCFAVWSRSRGMKHREILSKNENFSCIDNISLPLHPRGGDLVR